MKRNVFALFACMLLACLSARADVLPPAIPAPPCLMEIGETMRSPRGYSTTVHLATNDEQYALMDAELFVDGLRTVTVNPESGETASSPSVRQWFESHGARTLEWKARMYPLDASFPVQVFTCTAETTLEIPECVQPVAVPVAAESISDRSGAQLVVEIGNASAENVLFYFAPYVDGKPDYSRVSGPVKPALREEQYAAGSLVRAHVPTRMWANLTGATVEEGEVLFEQSGSYAFWAIPSVACYADTTEHPEFPYHVFEVPNRPNCLPNCPPPPPPTCMVPKATTGPAFNIGYNQGMIFGVAENPQSDLIQAASAWFEYGVSKSDLDFTTQAMSIGAGPTSLSVLLTGLLPNTTYYYRLVAVNACGEDAKDEPLSFRTASFSGPLLVVERNGAFSGLSVSPGAANVRIGSYTLTASPAEGVNVFTVAVKMSGNAGEFRNVRVFFNDVQFGMTKPTVQPFEEVMFSGNVAVPPGTSKVLDLRADVSEFAFPGLKPALTTLMGVVGVGTVTQASTNGVGAPIAGQNTLVETLGPQVVVTTDSATPAAQQIVHGSAGNVLAVFRVAEIANIEGRTITEIILRDHTSVGAPTAFSSLTLSSGASTAEGVLVATGSGYDYRFTFATPIPIAKNGSTIVRLAGNAGTFYGVQGGRHTFSWLDAAARGTTSNNVVDVIGNPSGSMVTVLRSKLSVSGGTVGARTGRVRMADDHIANIAFTAISDAATVSSLKFTLQGSAVASTVVALVEEGGAVAATATCTASGPTCTAALDLNPDLVIEADASRTLKLLVNSSAFKNAAGMSDSLAITIFSAEDVTWSEGTTTGIPLEDSRVPIVVATASYE